MAAEQAAPPAYFAGTSAEFQAIADVLLQTRDGAQLPAHSQLLASTSPLLCDMLKVAASSTPAGSKSVLQLEDFSEQEAIDVLKARAPGEVQAGQDSVPSGSGLPCTCPPLTCFTVEGVLDDTLGKVVKLHCSPAGRLSCDEQ